MSRGVSLVAMLFLLSPLAVWGQREGHRGATSTGTGSVTTPVEDPDVATFKHAIAVQATDIQVEQFRRMIRSTESARQKARELQQLSVAAADTEILFSKAAGLQNFVYEAQSENRSFRRSLSDSQEAGLTKLTKKLRKSNSAVSKSAKAIAQQVDQDTLTAGSLARATANLEKALSEFHSDQLNLGKDMGIQPSGGREE